MQDNLDRTFAALGDGTRRAILARLADGAATVGELAAPFAISLPAISRHLSILEDAGLILREREGQRRRCRLAPSGFRRAVDWLEVYRRHWDDSFDRLESYLEELRTLETSAGTADGKETEGKDQ